MSFVRSRRILVAMIAVVVVVLAACLAYYHERKVLGALDGLSTGYFMSASTEALRKDFAHAVVVDGAARAYAEFANAIADVPPNKQHELAHDFGDALYDAVGVQGFAICDSRFEYGCFHQMLGRAVADRGEGALPELYRVCTESGTKKFICLHGIGHGIVISFGYKESDLDKALSTCDALSPDTGLAFWCYGGVFMEYNQQFFLGEQYVRQIGSGSNALYEPCYSLGERYQKACMMEQPLWWHRVLFNGAQNTATFAKLGAYCENGPLSDALVRTCFESIGNISSAAAVYDTSRDITFCNASSNIPLHQLYCRSMAALSYFSAEHNIAAAERMCEGLSGDADAFCLAYAHNKANVGHPLPEPHL